MKTFTAKVEIPNQNPRYIPNCVIHKGKLASVYKKGIGKPRIEFWTNGIDDCGEDEVFDNYVDCYKAYINSTLLSQNNITKEEAKKLIDENQDNAWTDERLYNCLFVMGQNPNGYIVYDADEAERQKRAIEEKEEQESFKNKTVIINFERGIFGFETRRLPSNVWKLIAPFGTYHKGDESDMEWADDMGYYGADKNDLIGWFYSKDALQALLNSGYKVSYLGVQISSINEMDIVYNEKMDTKKKEYEAWKKHNLAKNELILKWCSFYKNGLCISEKEACEISNTAKTIFPKLEISGHNIYGGGAYLHVTNDYLYIVKNNGGDGDDWSRNNYNTGGAGAIVVRVDRTKEVDDFLNSAKEFETKTVTDF